MVPIASLTGTQYSELELERLCHPTIPGAVPLLPTAHLEDDGSKDSFIHFGSRIKTLELFDWMTAQLHPSIHPFIPPSICLSIYLSLHTGACWSKPGLTRCFQALLPEPRRCRPPHPHEANGNNPALHTPADP